MPTFLSGALADRTPESLNDVDRRATWVDERDPIYGRNIDPLPKGAGIAQKSPFSRREVTETHKQAVALAAGHRTGDVLTPQRGGRSHAGGHPRDHVRHVGAEIARRFDATVERDHPAQAILARSFEQANLAGERASVGDLVTVARDQLAPLSPRTIGLVVHTDHHHLVVRQELARNRIAKRQPMQHRPEHRLVVHRRDLEIQQARLAA